MVYNELGKTGIRISSIGYGAGHIGSDGMDEKTVENLLHYIIDKGINFIDTARGYGLSEERIGTFLSVKRRKDVVLCTKVGYGIEGVEDWTYDCIIKGVERALSVMKTDYLDIVLLHTCPQWILEKFDVVKALDDMKRKGLIKAIGYSGDNEYLEFALNINEFDCYEGSFNIFDQKKSAWVLDKIQSDNKGFIAKRPVANAPWRFNETPHGNYCEEYWHRMKKMNVDFKSVDPAEVALRFTCFTKGITSAIIGTTNTKHIDDNISFLEKGQLDTSLYFALKKAFFNNSQIWRSEV